MTDDRWNLVPDLTEDMRQIKRAFSLAVAALVLLIVFLAAMSTRAEEFTRGDNYGGVRGGIVQPPTAAPAGTCNQGDWSFNQACCCSARWCHPIPCETIRHDGRNYILTLRPGDHPNVREPTRWRVDEAAVETTPNGMCYACVGYGSLRCLLVPSAGS